VANKYPFWQHYPRDFEADAEADAMSTLALGAFLRLLHKGWDQVPVGTIPNDDSILARWARLSESDWTGIRVEVLKAYKLGKDNRWHQHRQIREYRRLLEYSKSKSKAGKLGARKRYGPKDLRDKENVAQLQHSHDTAKHGHSYTSVSASANSPLPPKGELRYAKRQRGRPRSTAHGPPNVPSQNHSAALAFVAELRPEQLSEAVADYVSAHPSMNDIAKRKVHESPCTCEPFADWIFAKLVEAK